MRDLLKEAEVNIIHTCVAHRSALNMIDALESFGRKYIDSSGSAGRDDFYNGLSRMKQGLHLELSSKMSNLLIFAGVGGIEAKRYAFDQFKSWFDDSEQFTVANFLNGHGNYPSVWSSDDEELLRKQAKAKIEDIEIIYKE